MAVVYDAVASRNNNSADPQEWNHTVAADANFLIVLLGYVGTIGAGGVSVGGEACTVCPDVTQGYGTPGMKSYYIVGPTTGTVSVSVDLSGAGLIRAGSMSFKGVDPNTPFGTNADGGVVTAPVNGAIVAHQGSRRYDCDNVVFSITGGTFTETYEECYAEGSYRRQAAGGYSIPPTGASQTVSVNQGSLQTFVLRASQGGNQVIWIMFERMQEFYDDLRRGLVPPELLRQKYQEMFI